jgi:hypothetical protein
MRNGHLIDRLSALDPLLSPSVSPGDSAQIQVRLQQMIGASARESTPRRAWVGRRRVSIAAVCLALLAVPSIAFGNDILGLFDGSPVPAESLSAHDWSALAAIGKGVPLGTDLVGIDLRGVGVSSVIALDRPGASRFVVIRRADGSSCYAVSATGSGHLIDSAECPGGANRFPSQAMPVLDISVFRSDSQGETRVSKLDGFASDAVANVELERSDGTALVRVPVVNNTYSLEPPSAFAGAYTLVAFDKSGSAVWHQCVAVRGC